MSPIRQLSSALTLLLAAPILAQAASKRGLDYNDAGLANLFSNYPSVSWAYNWAYPPGPLASRLEFVPMLYGDPTGNADWARSWSTAVSSAIASGSKHLLAFNEPDINNLQPSTAAAAWKAYVQPWAGKIKLGAPVVTNGGPPTGLVWLDQFLGNCTGCTIDFVPIHWYESSSNIGYFTWYLEQAHQAAGNRPLWMTEFGASGSDAQQAAFLKTVLPWMDSLDYLERYAYFGVFKSTPGGTFLVNQAGNGLSDSGMAYATVTAVNATRPTSLLYL